MNGSGTVIGARSASDSAPRARMMPEGSGAAYVASWLSTDGRVCYQLMEAPSRGSLDEWIANWSDLVEFEVIEVETSAEFWRKRAE
ncbi:MAG: DUF3303 family protein [Phycisphaerales bacterium]|nr:DUF3303 family protein [Phycisphaerales bacterium]